MRHERGIHALSQVGRPGIAIAGTDASAAHQTIGTLLERGRADGSFRTDRPTGWLVAACIALIHACSDQVRGGQIEPDDAVRILTTSVRDLFIGPRPGRPRRHAGH
jgi:hypothetical protein